MKAYIKGLTLLGVAASLGACTDLDTEVTTQYTKIPDNPIIVQSEFEGCYYYTRNEAWFGRNFWEGVLMQGNEMLGGCYGTGNYYDSGRYMRACFHDLAPDTPGTGLLGDILSGLSYTNERIRNFGGEDKKDAIVAPLRAIRAYYQFWMMELIGDCPIMDHVYTEEDPAQRQPRADVARFIESELLEIIDQKKDNGESALDEECTAANYGRPTKWLAEALLAKLYLNWGVYTNPIESVTANTPNEKLADCVRVCDEIIASGQFDLGKGYRKKFFPDNGPQIKDFIYAVPMDPETLGFNYNGGMELNRFCHFKKAGLCQPYMWGFEMTKSFAGNYVMTPDAVDCFNLPGDERNEMVLVGQVYAFDSDYNLTDQPVIVYKTNTYRKKDRELVFTKEIVWDDAPILSFGQDNDIANCMKGARLAKYPPNKENDAYSRKQSNDIPVFRLADVLLTKAECIVRGAAATNGDTPASLINKVRDCASAPHISGNVTLKDILDERTRELIMEPWSRNDLIRCGEFENTYALRTIDAAKGNTEKWRRLMPIQLDVMNANTNWSQNKGY